MQWCNSLEMRNDLVNFPVPLWLWRRVGRAEQPEVPEGSPGEDSLIASFSQSQLLQRHLYQYHYHYHHQRRLSDPSSSIDTWLRNGWKSKPNHRFSLLSTWIDLKTILGKNLILGLKTKNLQQVHIWKWRPGKVVESSSGNWGGRSQVGEWVISGGNQGHFKTQIFTSSNL